MKSRYQGFRIIPWIKSATAPLKKPGSKSKVRLDTYLPTDIILIIGSLFPLLLPLSPVPNQGTLNAETLMLISAAVSTICVPFQLRFGWRQIFARLLMAGASLYYVLFFIMMEFQTEMFSTQNVPRLCWVLGLQIYLLKADRIDLRIQATLAKERRMEKPFHILIIQNEIPDIGAVNAISEQLSTSREYWRGTAIIPIKVGTDPHQHTTGDPNFFLLGFSITGFEFIALGKYNSHAEASSNIHSAKDMLNILSAFLNTKKNVEPSDLAALLNPKPGFLLNAGIDTNIYNTIHWHLRLKWREKEKIAEALKVRLARIS